IIATPNVAPGDPSKDIVLDRVAHTGPLDPNTSYTASDTFTLPLQVSGGFAQPLLGRYHLFVRTDADSAVFMNERRAATAAEADKPSDVTPVPFADLVVSQVNAPATVQTGQSLHVSWQVVNQGIGVTQRTINPGVFAVDQGWSDAVSLATDPDGKNIVKQVSDFSFDHVGALAAGEGYQRSADVALPENLPAGNYYVVVQTGPRGGPYEFIYDDNNTTVSATPVRVTQGVAAAGLLVVQDDMTLPDLHVVAGSDVDLSWTVRNDGEADFTGTRIDTVSLQG